ncbi:MAG: hypothetical protein U9R73_00685 [Pseudomonadota bacterium]|nr:hypothetical protein [Pseudomonadota bacterium]
MTANVIDLTAKREELNDPIVDQLALTIFVHQSGDVSASFFNTGETNDQHWRAYAGLAWKLHNAIWQHIAKHTGDEADQLVMMSAIFKDMRRISSIDVDQVHTSEQFEWLRRQIRGLEGHVDELEAQG